MSKRIVSDPSLHGWTEENGKWVWEGGLTTGHIQDGDTEGQITTWHDSAQEWTPDPTVIVKGGDVGIGGDPGVTGSNLTGSINKLVLVGDGTKSGGLISTANGGRLEALFRASTNEGIIGTTTGHSLSLCTDGSPRLTIDAAGDATFSGDVSAATMRLCRSESSVSSGFYTSATTTSGYQSHMIQGDDGWIFDNKSNSRGWAWRKNGTNVATLNQSGFLDVIGGFTVNGSPVGGGLPDGDFTHNGKITATDFIATSDERVKDNITTAPVGLIDSLKGREWDWKESGEKGSGVVAQELEEVLPHLVHTDDEGMKSVAYNGLVAYLIEEVKALRAEVEALKS